MKGWVESEAAAHALGVTVRHFWVIAHRRKGREGEFRTQRINGKTWYHLDDIIDERERRGLDPGESC